MKKFVAALIFAMSLFQFSEIALAVEYKATVTIDTLLPVIADRPVEPTEISFTRIYFSAASSIGDTCRNTAADLINTDSNKHILAVILMAFAQNKPIKLWVDTTLRANNDDVCEITVAGLSR